MGTKIEPNLVTDALFSKTQSAVLGLLFGHADRSYYAKEIIGLARVGNGTVQRELQRLMAAGLIEVQKVGNQKHYQANRDSPVYRELVGIFSKVPGATCAIPAIAKTKANYTVGRNLSVPRKSLDVFCRRNNIKRLSLFGSVTRGDFRSASDIDVLVEFEPGHAPGLGGMTELRERLSRIFGGRKVDIVTPAILKNPHRRSTIERDLQTLYAAG